MKVRVLRRAQEDLAEIDAWLGRERPAAVDRTLEHILGGFAQLERVPSSGPLARDLVLRRRGYRTMTRGSYVTFYRVRQKTVFILRVLHARRSWKHLI